MWLGITTTIWFAAAAFWCLGMGLAINKYAVPLNKANFEGGPDLEGEEVNRAIAKDKRIAIRLVWLGGVFAIATMLYKVLV